VSVATSCHGDLDCGVEPVRFHLRLIVGAIEVDVFFQPETLYRTAGECLEAAAVPHSRSGRR
jgi:hypothetical protein